MKRVSVKWINEQIDQIKMSDLDLKPVTLYQKVRQDYSPIIVPKGKLSGHILTFPEAKKRQVSAGIKKEYQITYEEYNQLLLDFKLSYMDRLSIEGEVKEQRTKGLNWIKDHMPEYYDNVKDLPFQDIRDLFREAKEKAAKKGEFRYKDDNFFNTLQQLLYKRYPDTEPVSEYKEKKETEED